MPETETATEVATTEETGTTQEEGQPAELGDPGKQALDRMKAERNAAKAEAKKVQKELEELRQAHMSDQEKAIEEAKAAVRAEVLGQVGAKVAIAEFKAASTGRLDDDQLKTLLDGLDLKAFLDPEGDVDTDKVQSFIDGIAPSQEQHQRPVDLGQGARSTMALNGDPLEQALKNKLGIR